MRTRREKLFERKIREVGFHPRVGHSIKRNTIEDVITKRVAEALIRRSGEITKSSNFKYV